MCVSTNHYTELYAILLINLLTDILDTDHYQWRRDCLIQRLHKKM